MSVPGALAQRQRRRFLAALLSTGGLRSACSEAGVTLAQALSERIRDQAFRAAWQAADSERLDAVETLYIDYLVAALSGDGRADGPGAKASVLADKTLLTLWQALRDARRRAPAALPAASPAQAGPPPGTVRAEPASGPEPEDPAEMAALIAKVEAAISDAEAELGLR